MRDVPQPIQRTEAWIGSVTEGAHTPGSLRVREERKGL